MSRKYGPSRGMAGDADYQRHLAWCRHHGRYVKWGEYLEAIHKGSKYGPPGSSCHNPDSKRHKIWVHRHGWIDWEGYEAIRNARKNKHMDDMSEAAIAARVEKNREKFARLGLLAA